MNKQEDEIYEITSLQRRELKKIVFYLKYMSPRNFDMSNFSSSCGTKFCAIGERVAHRLRLRGKYGPRSRGPYPEDEFLEKCINYFNDVFDPEWVDCSFVDLKHPLWVCFFSHKVKDKTPKALAKRIERFLETGVLK